MSYMTPGQYLASTGRTSFLPQNTATPTTAAAPATASPIIGTPLTGIDGRIDTPQELMYLDKQPVQKRK
jgi:hypothetical protein